MSGGRLTIDDHGRITSHDDRCSMAFFRTGHLIANTGNGPVMSQRNLGGTNNHTTVICRVAQHDEWALSHVTILCRLF
jgi:hypothetical protein